MSGDQIEQPRTASSNEVEELQRLVAYIDMCRAKPFDVPADLTPGAFRLVGERRGQVFALAAANKSPNVKEFFERLAESESRLKTAEDRARDTPTFDAKIMAACWRLLHGEMLSLPPASRDARAWVTLDEGLGVVESLETEIKSDDGRKKISDLEARDANLALLFQVVRARKATFAQARDESSQTVTAELEEKTALLAEYREVLDWVLSADAALHVGDWEAAGKAYVEAAKKTRDLEQKVSNHEPARRRPFLFAAEPDPQQENPPALAFIGEASRAKVIPTVGALARLRSAREDRDLTTADRLQATLDAEQALQIKDAGPEIVAPDNPLGYVARGLIREYRASLLLRGSLSDPKAANLDEFQKTRNAAIADFAEAEKLLADRQVRIDSSHVLAFAGNPVFVITGILTANVKRNGTQAWSGVLKVVEDADDRLINPEALTTELYGYLAAGQPKQAWETAERLVELHGDKAAAWEDYVRTGLWIGRDPSELLTAMEAARAFRAFDAAPGVEKYLKARLAAATGLKELAAAQHDAVTEYLARQPATGRQEQERLERARGAFTSAVKGYAQALSELGAATKAPQTEYLERMRMLIRAGNAEAGALDSLVATALGKNIDAADLVPFHKDALLVMETAGERDLTALHGRGPADTLDALAAAKEAQALLTLGDGDADEIDEALRLLGEATDLSAELLGGQRRKGGIATLLLAAISYSEKTPRDSVGGGKVAQALKSLVEGMLLKDLGDPLDALRRVERVSRELAGTRATPASTRQAGSVWTLISDERALGATTVGKSAQLSAFLFQLGRLSPSYSRALGDLAEPSPVDADGVLSAALRLLGDDDPGEINLRVAGDALTKKTRKPLDALALALAAETKARSYRFTEIDERTRWLGLARQAVERANRLRVATSAADFRNRFPLLAQIEGQLRERLGLSGKFLDEAQFAESQYHFAEAEARLRDGIVHHPYASTLWSGLARLLIARWQLESRSSEPAAEGAAEKKLKQSLDEVLAGWKRHVPADDWERELILTELLTIVERYGDAWAALRRATALAPRGDSSAMSALASKRAEITSLLFLRRGR